MTRNIIGLRNDEIEASRKKYGNNSLKKEKTSLPQLTFSLKLQNKVTNSILKNSQKISSI